VAAMAEFEARPTAAERANQTARAAVVPRLRDVIRAVLCVSAEAVEDRAREIDRRGIQAWRRGRCRDDMLDDIGDEERVHRVRNGGIARRTTPPLKKPQAPLAESVPAVKSHRPPTGRRHQKVTDRALEEGE
jgi:hypothetical protein